MCHSLVYTFTRRSWWHHQMETFSALLVLYAGNSPVTGEFPAQRPVTQSFDVFFDLRLDKRLSKQSGRWWFETTSCPLWRHCNYISPGANSCGASPCKNGGSCRNVLDHYLCECRHKFTGPSCDRSEWYSRSSEISLVLVNYRKISNIRRTKSQT